MLYFKQSTSASLAFETKMFKVIKILIYIAVAGTIVFLYWFMPKYSFVQKNQGYCVNLTEHLYYCGTQADLKAMFQK
jgi:hypothetical protein